MKKLRGFLELARLPETAVVVAGTVIGWFLAPRTAFGASDVVAMATSNGLLFAASLAVNDWHDAPEDRINKPRRPIPAGRIERREALAAAAVLFLAAAIVAGWVDRVFGLGALAVTGLSVSYSLRLKAVPLSGNALVALLSTYPLWCWMLVADGMPPAFPALVLCCFLFRLGAEILKTAEDFPGDGACGIRTVATLLGVAAANRIGSTLLCTALLVAWVPVATGAANGVYTAGLLLSTALAGYGWTRAFFFATPEPGRSFVLLERSIMVLMSIAFLALALG